MRSPIDSLVTTKALQLISTSRNDSFLDLISEDKLEHNIPLKNVCVKVAPQLAEELDTLCNFLSVSKRSFLEAAIIEAIQQAHQIIENEGVYEALEGNRGVTLKVVEE